MMRYFRFLLVCSLVVFVALWACACATTSGKKGEGKGTTDIGLGKGIEGSEIPGEGLDGTVYGLGDIYFEYDKSSLTPDAQNTLKSNADWLKGSPSVMVEIEGHCDERGTIEYNLALGDRRARSVKEFLTNLGISASRITTISYGKEMPIDQGHNEAAWAKNRRAHFVIISK